MGAYVARSDRAGRRIWLLVGLGAVAGLLVLAACTEKKKEAAPAALRVFPGGYVGAEACGKCHENRYDGWKASGHAAILRTAEEARVAGIPKPSYVAWKDIAYVIGGKVWKARYISKADGYIITAGVNPERKTPVTGKNQYNAATGRFVDFKAGEKVPYGCGKCHTTGYKPEGHQDGLEGIVGTWVFANVQCEACHGPGADHAKSKKKEDLKVADPSESCTGCHVRGKDMTVIPAKDGFIDHHEQAQELAQSPHAKVSCVKCHRPHRPRGAFVSGCEECHGQVAAKFATTAMAKAGITCTACHMPPAGKSAMTSSIYEGDVRTHLFGINLDPKASLFYTKGGEQFANGKSGMTLDFACLRCHADRSKTWAAGEAKGFHD